jgi:hypothetical protein
MPLCSPFIGGGSLRSCFKNPLSSNFETSKQERQIAKLQENQGLILTQDCLSVRVNPFRQGFKTASKRCSISSGKRMDVGMGVSGVMRAIPVFIV